MQVPSPLDNAILDVVRDELSKYGDVATVRHEWAEGPRMWFVQVDPFNAEAAPLSVAFDGDDDLSVTIGRTKFEMFRFGETSLYEFRQMVRAVLAGQIEEAGGKSEGAGTVRIFTVRGPRNVGAIFPWPLRLRSRHRYQPYGWSLVGAVEALLYRHDPIGINFGDNSDEYEPEAKSIAARLPQCQSVEDVRALVHEEFVRWFDDDISGTATRYEEIARELWGAWQDRREAP